MDTFIYLSDACLEAQKSGPTDEVWIELRRRVPQMLENPPCAASRQAFRRLVRILGARTPQIAHQSELCTVFMQYLEIHKKAWSHRVFAIDGLGALCEIENDNVRGLRSNIFSVLVDCTRSGSLFNYRLALLQALKASCGSQSDSAKVAWKYARSLVFDTSLAVSQASIDLMEALCRPDFVRTQAKLDKVGQLCAKGWKEGKSMHKLMLKAITCAEQAKVTTVQAQLALRCQEYSNVAASVADGYVALIAEILLLNPQEFQIYVSMIPKIFETPKMRDAAALQRAYSHAKYLLVDVVAGALTEEKQKFALVQSVLTKLATTDKHHQVLAACYVMILEHLLELVVVSPQFAEILYQTEIALFELSTSQDLTAKIVRLMVKTVEKVPQFYTPLAEFALPCPAKKHALLLGALLVSSKHHMAEIKPKIIETAVALVKQKGKDFNLESHTKGWVLLEAFCCTPAKALRLFIPTYMSLFAHMLSCSNEKDSNSMRYRIEVWKPVLDCLAAFSLTALITPDISRKLGGLLETVWKSLEGLRWQDELEGQEAEVRQRLLKCFYCIDPQGDGSFYPATLLIHSLALIVEPSDLAIESSVLYDTPKHSSSVEYAQKTILKLFPHQLDRVKESLLDSLRGSIEATPNDGLYLLFSEICAIQLNDARLVRTVDGLLKTCLKRGSPHSSTAAEHYISQSPELYKYLLDQIVATTEPSERTSYVLALTAAIKAGGVSPHNLRQTLDLLLTLSKDPHPAVHMAAIDCVCTTASRSGLLGEKEATKLLEHLTELYLSDAHSCASSIVEYSNLEFVPRNSWFRILSGLTNLISLFGPSLQDSDKLFALLHRLVDQLPFVTLTWECYQELFYYAKERINWLEIIGQWRRALKGELGTEAARGILLFANRNASRLFDLTGHEFQNELWIAYDEAPNEPLSQILEVWAEQTVTLQPQQWIARLQSVISRPKREAVTERPDDEHNEAEEDEGLGPQSEARSDLYNPHTRMLALRILKDIAVSQLHDKPLAVRQKSLIVQNIGEIVKISFNAATCTVLDLQVQGLQLLNLLIKHLYDLKDPEFPDVSLLEQYQAQISSALTPAFNSDSSYELASAVIAVCGSFVGSRIIQNEKFNKILRLLTEPLSNESNVIGKLELQPLQAQALRVSILQFWAVLETDKSDVVLGHETLLAKLWVDALSLYTKLEFRPDDQNGSAFFAESLRAYRNYNEKEALLPVYRASWVDLVSALAVLVEKRGSDILGNEELLMGIVGLCFAELLRGGEHLPVLMALRQILQPGVCASLVYNEEIFLEVVEILDRIVLTGSVAEKSCVIEIARSLAMSQADSDDSVDHLFEIFRTCVFPLKELFPFLLSPQNTLNTQAIEQLPLIKLALESLIDMAQVFREVIQNDQFCCLLFVFEQIFLREDCAEIAPHLFGAFKRLVQLMAQRDLQKPLCDYLVRTLEHELKQNVVLEVMVLLCAANETLALAAGNIRQFGARLATEALSDDGQIPVQSIKSIIKSTSGLTQAAFLAGVVPTLVSALPDSTSLPKNACNLLVDYVRYSSDSATAMAIVIPCLLHVLHSEWDTDDRRKMYIRALLLILVDAHPLSFKQQMTAVKAQDKQTVQDLLLEPAEPEAIETVSDVIALTSFD